MKKFLTRILLFLLPVIIALVGCELYVRSLPNIHAYKNQWLNANSKHVNTLILGNSRAFNCIMPSLLGNNSFNLANPQQQLEYDWFLLNKYDFDSLKTVIITLDEVSLLLPSLEDQQSNYCCFYKIYMGYDKHSWFSKYNFEMLNYPSWMLKIRNYWNLVANGDSPLACDSLGWCGVDSTIPTQKSMRHDAGIVTKHYGDTASYNRNMAYARSIAKLCQQRGINLVMVTLPYYYEYVDMLGEQSDNVTRQAAEQLANDYGAIYLNYRNDKRFEFEDFADGGHLSSKGARKFTLILNDDLNKILKQ
ncbi:MAG: hypothetical protein IK092_01420 [Muribaculaceae bacterium]|nr:hypothetical protein [Muribaculaceae bacterium]